ncbi:YfiT family bacillithiol transferase [Flavobacteriaceae bacterium M23B6Z8]
MQPAELKKLKYPIGKFKSPDTIETIHLIKWTDTLETLPTRLNELVKGLSEKELKLQYRLDGWTIREVVHHIADSHHNSYTRFKWTLTEDTPLIKAYDESAWAALFDTQNAPIQLSVDYLYALHAKLVYLIKGLSEEQLQRAFIHPEDHSRTSLKENIGKYAWHSEHHLAHIKNALATL